MRGRVSIGGGKLGFNLCPFWVAVGSVSIVSARFVAQILDVFPEWWRWSVMRHWRIGPVWLVWYPDDVEPPRQKVAPTVGEDTQSAERRGHSLSTG